MDGGDPAQQAITIVEELAKYSEALADKPRWLVLNKTDLLSEDEIQERTAAVVAALDWQGPIYQISALQGNARDKLVYDIMAYLESLPKEQPQQDEAPETVEFKWDHYHDRQIQQAQQEFDEDDFDDDDDLDDDFEVIYTKE